MVSVQRHLALLRGALRPDEREQAWARADRADGGFSGALLLTDRRLLFSGLAFVAQSQEAWPLATLGVDGVAERGRDAVLTVRVPGGAERFTGRAPDLRRLAALLPAEERGIDGGLAAEIEHLAALHAAGTLSDAEFATAKARLLR